MLSKEEIARAKERISKSVNDVLYGVLYSQEENEEDEKILLQYIEQLESEKQNLIEKLEEDKRKNNEFDFYPLQVEKAYNNYYKLGKIDEAEEILSITKGEKNELK